jgi:hypothetical protein
MTDMDTSGFRGVRPLSGVEADRGLRMDLDGRLARFFHLAASWPDKSRGSLEGRP